MAAAKTKKIVILGTGGNCIDILDIVNDINDARGGCVCECAGFLDDDESKWGQEICGVKVLGPLSFAPKCGDCFFINGIGSPSNFRVRQTIIAKTDVGLDRFETLIHPTACVSRLSRLGRGTVIFPKVTIASQVQVGNHVLILPGSVVSHNDVVGDYSLIASGACISGNVRIGQSRYIGANASITSAISIGDYCLIGMGAVVLRHVQDYAVMVGNPARCLRTT